MMFGLEIIFVSVRDWRKLMTDRNPVELSVPKLKVPPRSGIRPWVIDALSEGLNVPARGIKYLPISPRSAPPGNGKVDGMDTVEAANVMLGDQSMPNASLFVSFVSTILVSM